MKNFNMAVLSINQRVVVIFNWKVIMVEIHGDSKVYFFYMYVESVRGLLLVFWR